METYRTTTDEGSLHGVHPDCEHHLGYITRPPGTNRSRRAGHSVLSSQETSLYPSDFRPRKLKSNPPKAGCGSRWLHPMDAQDRLYHYH